MQGNAIELGGFKGRTNKLVDGCYSWWVGGCAILAEGLLAGSTGHHGHEHETKEGDDEVWDDIDGKWPLREVIACVNLYPGFQIRYLTGKRYRSMCYMRHSTMLEVWSINHPSLFTFLFTKRVLPYLRFVDPQMHITLCIASRVSP